MSKNKKEINEHLVLIVAVALVMILSLGGLAFINKPAQAENGSNKTVISQLEDFKNNAAEKISAFTDTIQSRVESISFDQDWAWPSIDLSTIQRLPQLAEDQMIETLHGIGETIIAFENYAKDVSAQTASLFSPNKEIDTQAIETAATIHLDETKWTKVASLEDDVIALNNIEPSVGEEEPVEYADIQEPEYGFPIEQEDLSTEGVLVPKKKTIISSSRDGKIAKVYVDNGDLFKKNDILLEYDCKDARSEVEIAKLDKEFKKKQLNTTMRLLKLDLISDVEEAKIKTESQQASQRVRLSRSKLDHCYIVATYNGRVVRRLANPNEYTRTDRVLLEVASTETMDVEFLIPSKWLRWVNIDAPFALQLNETGKIYEGKVTRIYGEVDPVSQSIQIRGSLNGYDEKLLPGMSGNIEINANDVRSAGIAGYLEDPQEQ